MVADLTPLKRIKCSYDDCFHSFDNENQMRAHLKNPDIHPYYCGKTPSAEKLKRGFAKCDFHGKCFEDLVAHKVENMMPFLVGKRRNEIPKKLNHIVCEFCGIDFGSLSGREAHRKQMHQADQHIACKGYINVRDAEGYLVKEECGMVFGSASQLIRHIEGGFCPYIKPRMLEEEREHGQLVKKILEDPDGFRENLQKQPCPDLAGDLDDTTSGGVTIDRLSRDGFSQDINSAPVSPTLRQTSFVQAMPKEAQRGYGGDWPSLPSNLNKSMNALSIGSSNATLYSTNNMTSPSNLTHSRVNLASETTETNSDAGSITPPATPTGPWLTGNSSQHLFEGKRPEITMQPNWDAINNAHKRSKMEDEKSNLFYARFWDPDHEDFQPHLFYKPEQDHRVPPYQCPFGDCLRRFSQSDEIGDHIRDSHAVQPNMCPVCCKLFEKLSGLVAHCEASSRGSKCGIARRPGYDRFIYKITGGLVSATKAPEEPIHGYKLDESALKKGEAEDGQLAAERGVKDYDYTAIAPSRPALSKW